MVNWFKKKVVPVLEFRHMPYLYQGGNIGVVVLHVEDKIHGVITKTEYGTHKINLNGLTAETFTFEDAKNLCLEKWNSFHR